MFGNAENGSVTFDGVTMHYMKCGTGRRYLIVLPGLADGLTTVEGKALLLAPAYRKYWDNFTVLMFSRRDSLPEGFTIEDMAEDQAKAMRALGIGRACALGVSQGGMVAQALAAAHPNKVRRLVLAVTAPYANATVRACVESWIRMAEAGDHKALMADTAEHTYTERYLRFYRLLYPALGIGKPADYSRFLVNARAILGFDAREVLHKITCPTLILGGAKDAIVGVEASGELHRLIPQSSLHIYPECGHAPYDEEKGFYRDVYEFLTLRNVD